MKKNGPRNCPIWIRLAAITSLMTSATAIVYIINLSSRLNAIENVVKGREAADPLVPDECPTKDIVCNTTIAKIISSPQKYHDLKVSVEGIYLADQESSALYETPTNGELSHSRALWINDVLPKALNHRTVSVVGTFERGPTGHMDEFPGQLKNVTVIESHK